MFLSLFQFWRLQITRLLPFIQLIPEFLFLKPNACCAVCFASLHYHSLISTFVFCSLCSVAHLLSPHYSGHNGKVHSLSWSFDSMNLVSASQDGKLILWNCASINKILAIPLRSSWVMSCCFSPSATLVATANGTENLCSVYKVNLVRHI